MGPLTGQGLGFVGAGAMAEALIGGVLARGLASPAAMVASHPRPDRREQLVTRYGIKAVAGNREVVERADLVFLCVKPQMLIRVLSELAGLVPADRLVVSIVAGAPTAVLGATLRHPALVRAMPNTPAQIGAGTTVWYATPETTEAQRAQARSILSALGTEVEVQDEELVAMATAVSGTGPTYIFLVMEALIDSAVHLGFPRHMAHALVLDTVLGSARFAQYSGRHLAQLRDMVTSPGGTSAAALHALEDGRLRTVLADAVWAAYRRTQALTDALAAQAATPLPRVLPSPRKRKARVLPSPRKGKARVIPSPRKEKARVLPSPRKGDARTIPSPLEGEGQGGGAPTRGAT